LNDLKYLEITASSWSGTIQINRVAQASDAGSVLDGKQRDPSIDGVVGSVLAGGKGNDRIQAMAGWDIVDGGEGDDLVRSGNGRDILSGGPGKDELWGGFGWNTYTGDKDNSEDLLVIKSDEWQVNPLNGKAANNPDGSKTDIIEALDSIDQIIIQGVNTSELRFVSNSTGHGLTGIGIYAKSTLEALYTGGDLSVEQLIAMTTGDITGPANGSYRSW
jgi:Ca2+-binding RTX toxin-like protein